MPGIGRQTFQAIRNQAAKGNNILVLPDQNARFRRFFYKFRRLTCPASRLRQIVPTFQLLPQCRLHFQRLFNSFFNRRLIKIGIRDRRKQIFGNQMVDLICHRTSLLAKPCRHRADTLRHPQANPALPPHPAAYRRHRPPYSPCIRPFPDIDNKTFSGPLFTPPIASIMSYIICISRDLYS